MRDATEQKKLLSLARSALGAAIDKAPPPATPALTDDSNHGAFVTLYSPGHALRGCIGTFSGGAPLAETIAEMAVAAGLRDPRFPSVTSAELTGLQIEISLLSKAAPARAEDIVLGEHGVILKRGFLRSVFLPKVATEQGWNKEEMFRQLSLKANLPEDAWQWSGSSFEIFTAEVFAED